MAVTDYLERGALVNPDGPCVIHGERRLSYRETLALVNRIANGLAAAGYGLGRHAGVLCDNDPLGYACTLGVMRSGMAYVPMDFRNTAADNFRILEFGDCEALFYQARFHDQVQELRPGLPKLELLVCIDARRDDVPRLADWLAPHGDTAPRVEIPLEATAWLQTGSGTSGEFRMTMISHRAYHAFVAHQLITWPDPGPVMLVAAPITHAGGGLSYHVLACGGPLVLLERPEPQLVLSSIEEHGITKLFLPPTVIYRLLAQPNVRTFDYSSLRYLISSAAPFAVDKLREAIETFGPVVAQGYGQTEALGIAALAPAEYLVDGEPASDVRLAACGRPALPFCRVAIVDDASERLPQGEVGEICVRGDQVMTGYYKDPVATGRTIVDGWLHTGDVGFLDGEGYLHVVDRKRDLIITGGFNVYPAEVERVLASFEAVEDCAVVGVPDDDWGEAVKAVVQLRPGMTVEAETLIAACKERIGSVKAPKSIDFVEELPRSPRGKVLRRVLRDEYWQGLGRRI